MFVEWYIGCMTLGLLCLLSGKILFNTKKYPGIIKSIVSILVVALLSMLINIYATDIFTTIIKIIITYIILCFYYVIIYKRSSSESIAAGFITYLIIFISETIVAMLLSMILEIFHYESMALLKNTIIINTIIYIISYSIIIINKKRLINLIKGNDFSNKGNSVITFLIIFTIALLGIKIPLTDWHFNIDFIITMLILFCCCIIGFLILKQKSIIKKTTSMYQQLVEYSDITNKLLEDYRTVSHEHKNQLLIISSMLENNDTEITEYIENLLEKRNIIKYQWIGELNRLPLSGLKGLINYKLIEMENNGFDICISISKDLMKLKLNNLTTKQKDNLYSIIGVYLDNAIEATKNSIKKEISLEIYKNKKDIVIILANTYSGEIDLDKIDNYGYTTKGKNHGIGLHLVKKIIDVDNTFSQNRSIFEDYYVQELRIHMNKIKSKLQKK